MSDSQFPLEIALQRDRQALTGLWPMQAEKAGRLKTLYNCFGCPRVKIAGEAETVVAKVC